MRVIISTIVLAMWAAGCAGPAIIGHVTWVSEPRPAPVALADAYHDGQSLQVASGGVVTLLLNADTDAPVVLKAGSRDQPTIVRVQNIGNQLNVWLDRGTMQIFLGGRHVAPADVATQARVLIHTAAYDQPRDALQADNQPPGGTGPVAPIYLSTVPDPIVIGLGRTVFIASAEKDGQVYCACSANSTVKVWQGAGNPQPFDLASLQQVFLRPGKPILIQPDSYSPTVLAAIVRSDADRERELAEVIRRPKEMLMQEDLLRITGVGAGSPFRARSWSATGSRAELPVMPPAPAAP